MTLIFTDPKGLIFTDPKGLIFADPKGLIFTDPKGLIFTDPEGLGPEQLIWKKRGTALFFETELRGPA